ncbi:MAG: hypothetical protein WC852_06710 [Candidatus Nanoarchaeia archaeon]|jgi:uncharacterized membrane protein YccF (DUF307 family)
MSLLKDIGTGMLGIILLIISFILFGLGLVLLFSGHGIIGIILVIVAIGIAIASRKRIHGH